MTRLTMTSVLAVCLIAAMPASISSAQEAKPAPAASADANETLGKILAAQSDETKARYGARRPAETLSFCEVKPGDTVIEALPGGGWYSRILYPYLGKSGQLIGAQYPESLFKRFGWDAKRLQTVLDRDKGWADAIQTNPVAEGSTIETYHMTEMPDRFDGKADKVLFIRALHNLKRFDEAAGYLKNSLAEVYRSLKPGGVACVVQHQAPETASAKWADGSAGYVKKSDVVAAFEAAGFKLAASSDINLNPKDQPTEKDVVWRLPPNFRGVEKDSAAWQAVNDIGESTRMTLKFVKPNS